MPHLLGNGRHREIIFAGQVGQEEELGEGKIATVQLTRKVEDARPLGHHDEIGETICIDLLGVGSVQRAGFHGLTRERVLVIHKGYSQSMIASGRRLTTNSNFNQAVNSYFLNKMDTVDIWRPKLPLFFNIFGILTILRG